jgi:hypothetical protein
MFIILTECAPAPGLEGLQAGALADLPNVVPLVLAMSGWASAQQLRSEWPSEVAGASCT